MSPTDSAATPLLVIRNSRTRYLVLLCIAAAFVACGVFLVTHVKGEGFWVGWLCILFFGAGLVLFVRQLFDSRPRVVIDAQGIHDRTLGVGRIPWADIQGAHVRTVHGNAFVCLVLRDPQVWVAKLPRMQQRMTKANLAMGFEALNVNLSGTSEDPESVKELILRQCRLHANG